MAATPEVLKVRGDMVLLQAALKLLDEIQTGGEVREYLAEAGLKVNGEPEGRRGRKLYEGDRIEFPSGRVVTIATGF